MMQKPGNALANLDHQKTDAIIIIGVNPGEKNKNTSWSVKLFQLLWSL